MSEKYSLTPVELELMDILWKIGQGTVRDVMAQLPSKRSLAYTSVSTILRILEQKKVLATNKIGKQHIYIPLFSKKKFASHSVNKFVKQIFSGNPAELVAYLMHKQDISLDELDAIQTIIDAKKKEMS